MQSYLFAAVDYFCDPFYNTSQNALPIFICEYQRNQREKNLPQITRNSAELFFLTDI